MRPLLALVLSLACTAYVVFADQNKISISYDKITTLVFVEEIIDVELGSQEYDGKVKGRYLLLRAAKADASPTSLFVRYGKKQQHYYVAEIFPDKQAPLQYSIPSKQPKQEISTDQERSSPFTSLLNEIHSSEYDISPLHIATANGNLAILTLLLDSGAHRNAKYVHGSTVSPLHLAAAQGYVAAVQLLLERGARINQLASRWTPLHVAVWMNQIDVAKVLIDRGAKINPVTHTKNHWSKTPYELAKTTEMRNLLQASGGRRLSLIEKVFPSLLAPG